MESQKLSRRQRADLQNRDKELGMDVFFTELNRLMDPAGGATRQHLERLRNA